MPLGLPMQVRTMSKCINFALQFQPVAEKLANKFKGHFLPHPVD